MIGINSKRTSTDAVKEWPTDDNLTVDSLAVDTFTVDSSEVKPLAVKGKSGLDVLGEIHTLLGKLGESYIKPAAYDMAWIARLGEHDATLAANALAWLRGNQLADGGWGALEPLYHHDRVLNTLAAIVALLRNGAPEDEARIQAALPALQHSLANLDQDLAGMTAAFEMLFPSLIDEAKTLGLTIDDPNGLVQRMVELRNLKVARAPKGLISRQSTICFSTEMAGPNGLELLDVEHLQQEDGSISASPAATAFFVNYVRPDPAALAYLHRIMSEERAATITAIECFERAWGVWHLKHAGVTDPVTTAHAKPVLDALAAAWHPGSGIAMNEAFLVQDGDHTAMVCELLVAAGYLPDLAALLHYEEDDHFRCYPIENGVSISTNIHVLGALRQVGYCQDDPVVQKVVTFLCHERTAGKFWLDKWHCSPYYTTGHAVTLCAGYLNPLVEDSVAWLLETQNDDGSWGFFGPTAEETAYALQGLMAWRQAGQSVPQDVLEQGIRWLAAHVDLPYSPLWISKSIYCPEHVVRMAVLSTLRQYELEFGALP